MPTAPLPICHLCHRTGCTCRQKARQQSDMERGSSAARGYNWRWQKYRERYLAERPLCSDCAGQGRVKAAKDVHHIHKLVDRHDLQYEPSNLMPLCRECHSKRTARGE